MTMTHHVDAAHSALLLIDFQRDFLADDGRMPVARNQVSSVIAAARAAIAEAQRRGILVVTIANAFRSSDRLMNFFRRHAAVEGSPGAEWDGRLAVTGAPALTKCQGDGFSNPELEKLLRSKNISHLIVTGLFARGCVTATIRGALKRGFSVSAIPAAIACSSDSSRSRALLRLVRMHVRMLDTLGEI
jgi:nicotinamidase-related amidase